jgi:hypothetical protein
MTERSYDELAGLAQMCALQARASTAKDVARELWNMALEYQKQATNFADGKRPEIGEPPPGV